MPTTEADLSIAPMRIVVVAGIIWSADRTQVLLSLRKPDQHQGNLWEFPGGKVETGEAHIAALKRELHEELAIDVLEAFPWQQIDHDYGDKSVCLDFWQVTSFEGEPKGREQQELRWVSIEALHEFEFPEANRPIVGLLQS